MGKYLLYRGLRCRLNYHRLQCRLLFSNNIFTNHPFVLPLAAESVDSTSRSGDHPDRFVKLSLQEKQTIIHFIVTVANSAVTALRTMVNRHQEMSLHTDTRVRKDAARLRSDFKSHQCTTACLILESEAVRTGILGKGALSPSEFQECCLVLNFRSHSNKRKLTATDERPGKQLRNSVEESTPSTLFPISLSQSQKDEIIREFRESTSNSALKQYECSFCGKFEFTSEVKMRSIKELDISLLEKSVQELRTASSQPRIESFQPSSLINDSSYVLCHLCNLSVSKKKRYPMNSKN